MLEQSLFQKTRTQAAHQSGNVHIVLWSCDKLRFENCALLQRMRINSMWMWYSHFTDENYRDIIILCVRGIADKNNSFFGTFLDSASTCEGT